MTPYYQDDAVCIYHGDCREVLPVVSADVLVTDPPYGVNLGNHRAANETRAWLARGTYVSYEDTLENFSAVVVQAVAAALEIVKRGLVFTSHSGLRLLPAYDAIGGVYLPAGMGRTCWGFQNFAWCALYGIAPDLHLGAKATGIRSTETAERNGHPCPKPYGWMTWAVLLSSHAGDTILDPFMGSGTTLVAAKRLGRKAIGIECELDYCRLAVERLRQSALPLELGA